MPNARPRTTPDDRGNGSLFAVDEKDCTHPPEMRRFLYTYDDFWDGDSDDVYECQCCGKRIRVYVPR